MEELKIKFRLLHLLSDSLGSTLRNLKSLKSRDLRDDYP